MSANAGLPSVSIIVPVLNEAGLIGAFLRQVRTLAPDLEIILVDGGSADETVSIARTLADEMIVAPRGRASQMNAGAALARAEILWFLHADSTAPANAIDEMCGALAEPRNAGGCFRLHYPRPHLIYRVSDRLGNLGVKVFGFALGDHGIFCRRSAFFQIGGYPGVPILEDAELYRGLRKVGKMHQLHETIVSDPRTFEKWGRFRTTAVYFLILVLYVTGAPIAWLHRIYRRFHQIETRLATARSDRLQIAVS
ncbi:MAG TPA: TIGR04283 family arsenosugar biosynthesis glycosyltransferase [Chthoniobacterales bacterium]|jgi:rSAM/selenodomain-associated transferase 2|nr:TIGR04283 family arsenosugar biosynthesis glycosyltransferase [Chthoniobacterales bacterium]